MAGVDRGIPIDRYFIEKFMQANAEAVRGVCLEIKDNNYTKFYGKDRVTHSDILDVNRENKDANIYADLRDLSVIPTGHYDCIILTQVLQYIDDLDKALSELKRILKPGGTLLVTVPTLGKLDGQEDHVFGHYWRLTPDSAKYLFEKHFAPNDLEIKGWGNVAVGLAFWVGLSVQDVGTKKLDLFDPNFTCGVTIRATS